MSGLTLEDFSSIHDIPMKLTVVVGSKTIRVSELMKLGRGAEVQLDSLVTDPVTIFMNNRAIARGELSTQDGRISVVLTEIFHSK